jgi:hypothetical protein
MMHIALLTCSQIGGIRSLDDYRVLYEGQWKMSVPSGIDVGTFSNGTTDLLFSMERLSASPFSVRRLHPTRDNLPFTVEADIVSNLTGFDLEFLHSRGSLFFADHSDQLVLPKTSIFSAACSAYFYIAPESGEFLPLAIKTNTDADLVYTPLDAKEDWLLAKIMMNSNEVVFNAAFHVAATHAVQEIVHLGALKTLSESHPVLALLNRRECSFSHRVLTLLTSGSHVQCVRSTADRNKSLDKPGGLLRHLHRHHWTWDRATHWRLLCKWWR